VHYNPRMSILSRYLAREAIAGTALVLAALLALYAFLDLIFQLPDLGKGGYRMLNIFLFVWLSLPGHVYELFPIAALIGTLYGLALLGTHSELTVMRASGLSLAGMALALVVVGVAFAAINFVFGEVIAPYTDKVAHRYRLESLNALVAQEFRSGLWVKDAHTFVNVQEMLPDTTLRNLKIYQFDSAHRLTSVSFARNGVYDLHRNNWRITEVEQTLFDASNKVTLKRLAEATWSSVVTPEILSVLLVVPEQMSVWNLFTYIEHLRENRQKTTAYEIAKWSKLIHPFALMAMMVLALPFSIHQRRSGGLGAKILTGIMLGIGYHLLNRLFASLGVLNDWDPLASAALPTLAVLALAGGMMWWVERR
jgi:lipopolysaccharide export system permease protein